MIVCVMPIHGSQVLLLFLLYVIKMLSNVIEMSYFDLLSFSMWLFISDETRNPCNDDDDVVVVVSYHP